MVFVFSIAARMTAASFVLQAIAASLLGISLLLGFIVLRRWWRGRYFARRERQMFVTRQRWDDLVSGKVRPQDWRFDELACEVLETMLLDSIEVSGPRELPELVDCLRRSGLLDKRIEEARLQVGWRRWRALVRLGRTRAPEAVPALADALDDPDMETRIAAVRGMGKLALPEAAVPMLERFCDGRLLVPWTVLKNALLNCCLRNSEVLLRYVRTVTGAPRELLVRVLAEMADESMSGELLVLASDASPEVRAAAARALARVDAHLALGPLTQLAADPEWFVRLRAVVSLGSFNGAEIMPVLVRALADRHRSVRQRAAWAVMNASPSPVEMVRRVIAAGDSYGLQAVVSELEACGRFAAVLHEVENSATSDARRIAVALKSARHRLRLSSEAAPQAEEVHA